MAERSIDLIWISVNDFQKAIKFYTEVVGLKLMESNEEWGWAELQGESGARLGIAKACDKSCLAPGQNAVISITVPDLDQAKAGMAKQGAEAVGEECVVPGHVRMQLYKDQDGNQFHVVQKLFASSPNS